jgi:hypothetical protein
MANEGIVSTNSLLKIICDLIETIWLLAIEMSLFAKEIGFSDERDLYLK